MALTLCPNCRLPVNSAAQQCPLCAATMLTAPLAVSRRRMPLAAAVVAVAAVTLLARRLA